MLGFFSYTQTRSYPAQTGRRGEATGVFLYNDTDQNFLANGRTAERNPSQKSIYQENPMGFLQTAGRSRFPVPSRINYIAYRPRTTHGGTAGQQTKKTPSTR